MCCGASWTERRIRYIMLNKQGRQRLSWIRTFLTALHTARSPRPGPRRFSQ
jgi:hypothetical protein